MECRHDGCTCQVEDGEFCSDHCREHAGHDEGSEGHACECGHPGCAAA
jgi:hypothetical protein